VYGVGFSIKGLGFRVKSEARHQSSFEGAPRGEESTKWTSKEISTEMLVNKMSLYDQFLISAIKRDRPICKAYYVGARTCPNTHDVSR